METYNAPLRPPNTPSSGDEISFPTALERARAARDQFNQVASQYGHTNPGRVARYMAALTTVDMGDNQSGEQQLQQVVAAGDPELSSLARLALAGVYRNTHRDKDALDTYQDLVSHPTVTVSKPMAQLQLASFYEATKQNSEAAKLYQEIAKENPGTTAASLARQHMQTGK
jgi:TolA-binding protein